MKMRRQLLAAIGLGLFVAPCLALAQQAGKTFRVALILGTSPVAVMAGPEPVHPFTRTLLHELRDRGYVEGKNLIFERRSAEGKAERSAEIMADLVRGKVDVIVVPVNELIQDAMRATTTVPIVMVYASSPVEAKLVASLSRPGGNVTGLTYDTGPEIEGKRLEMLKQALPRIARVAYVGTKADWTGERGQSAQAAARVLGLTLILAEHGHDEYANAFSVIRRERAQAFMTSNTTHHFTHRRLIAEFALKNALPSISRYGEMVEAGGLMSYGPNIQDNYRRAAIYVDKILKGARPADLPVEQPTVFELAINMKTAKALGINFPNSILVQATKVIE